MNIDLKSTKIYLISPAENKYRDRVLTVFGRLIDEGFKNITFIKSVPGPNNTASLTNTVIDIFKTELSQTRPFIILEDDCAFFHKYDYIEVPNNFDVLYLGLSLWAYPYSPNTLLYKPRPNIVPKSETTVVPYNDLLVQVKAMTGGHAILFYSREFIRQFLQKINEISQSIDDLPHDLLFSALHSFYNIYALKRPMFYQDKTLGGQEDVTKLILE